MNKKAILVTKSKNRKIGNVAATYAPIKNTCPNTCALKNKNGCYAERGFVGIHNRRMERHAKNDRPEAIARQEKDAILRSKVKKPLRLHVSGDARTNEAARILGRAAKKWRKENHPLIWNYTHSWKIVKRSSWGRHMSVLASVDSIKEANQAKKKNYVPAIVLDEFPSEKAFKLKGSNITWLPCPAQTRDFVTCESCKLCMKEQFLKKNNKGIAFEKH